jgi:hypothetical protein
MSSSASGSARPTGFERSSSFGRLQTGNGQVVIAQSGAAKGRRPHRRARPGSPVRRSTTSSSATPCKRARPATTQPGKPHSARVCPPPPCSWKRAMPAAGASLSTHRRIRWSPTRDAAQEIHTPDRPDLRHSADKRREWRGVQAVLSHPLELTSVTSAGILGCDRVLLLSFGLVLACRRYLTIHPA